MTVFSPKTLAACGLFAFATAALADASAVTFYGRLDTALESTQTGHRRVHGLNSSDAYFGFKGVEALVQGLKAGFVLESAIQTDDGATSQAGSFFSNRSEVFLEGAFGTVRMGRFFNPSYYAVADRTSLHNEDYGISADALYAGVENAANRLGYKSPTRHGLTLESTVSFHERDAAHQGHNAYDLAANYERGPWSFGAGYGAWADARQYAVRATWTQGDWTISGYHQRSQDRVAGVQAKTQVSRAAVAYAMGAGELHANFGHANAPGQAEADQWTVGYNHHLSARTKLYAFYTVLQNRHGAHFAAEDLAAGEDRKSLSVGIRHHF